jgi:hypothetical protein
MWIFTFLFSKAGSLLAGALGVLGLLLWGKYYKAKAEKAEARADGYQAQAEIAHGREEVQDEVEKMVEETHKKVQAGDAAGLSDDFNTLK